MQLSTMLDMLLEDIAQTEIVGPLMCDSKTELIGDEFYLTMRPHGLGVIASFDGRVSSIQLFSEGFQQYSQFVGMLPEGLSFGESRSSVSRRLGKPDATGGGEVIQFFGKVPTWDRFDRDQYSLHIQYADDEGSISLVSLIRPDSVPRSPLRGAK
jgi:hypothetical protein